MLLVVAGALTVGLVFVATKGTLYAGAAVGAAAYLVAIVIFGRVQVAGFTLIAAFATAPAYLGLASSPSAAITPTDVLLGLAVALFIPTMASRPLRLPLVYWVGLILIITTGVVASAASAEPVSSFINVCQWLLVLLGLPMLYVLWGPSQRWVQTLLWSYVVGHMASVAVALGGGTGANGRSAGLTHHPNAFAEAGVMVGAIVLYLFHVHRSVRARLVIVAVGAVAGGSVLLSGSRAAFVVFAVLIMMVPFVERSAPVGVVLGLLAGVALILLPVIVDISGEGSALARLQGSADAAVADSARWEANRIGWDLLFESPLLGSGYVSDLTVVHNAYLVVAATAGIFGLLGYLLVLYPLARPLFGSHPDRRMCYLVWAYIGLSATAPVLWDRTSWVPMALAILVAVRSRAAEPDPELGQPAVST